MANPNPEPHPENLRPPWRSGQSGNPAGRRTAGATIREHVYAMAEQALTEGELRAIARDKAEPWPRRAAAERDPADDGVGRPGGLRAADGGQDDGRAAGGRRCGGGGLDGGWARGNRMECKACGTVKKKPTMAIVNPGRQAITPDAGTFNASAISPGRAGRLQASPIEKGWSASAVIWAGPVCVPELSAPPWTSKPWIPPPPL